jgi:hypothetical protein
MTTGAKRIARLAKPGRNQLSSGLEAILETKKPLVRRDSYRRPVVPPSNRRITRDWQLAWMLSVNTTGSDAWPFDAEPVRTIGNKTVKAPRSGKQLAARRPYTIPG